LLGALGLDGLLAAANVAPAHQLVIHPVAPPLTRIAALGDAQLGVASPPARGLLRLAAQRAVQQVGSPAQRRDATFPPPDRARAERSRALRLAVEADAIALANLLGPERVRAFVARKEDLSEWYGEGRVWREAAGVAGGRAQPSAPGPTDPPTPLRSPRSP
jgi:hypothetical protein